MSHAPRERRSGAQWYESWTAGRESFVQRVLIVFGIGVGIGLLLWLLWIALDVLLLVFAGSLLAVFLNGLSQRLGRATGLSYRWALTAVSLGIIALAWLSGVLFWPSFAAQIDELREQLPPAVAQIQNEVLQYGWAQDLLERAPAPQDLLGSQNDMIAQATGIFSTTFSAILRFLIILFIGIYLAIDPGLYVRGLVRMAPLRYRPRARAILHAIGDTLWWWLVGRVIAMLLVGVMTWIGLWLLGVPLAFALGIIAALLDFIPNIGPWIAAVPGVLLALLQSPQQALYVALLYFVVQQIESYVITPIVQQKTVKLAPVVTIFAQVLLTFTLGGLGLLLASPLAAVVLVLVKMIYIEDVLGDPMDGTAAADRPAVDQPEAMLEG